LATQLAHGRALNENEKERRRQVHNIICDLSMETVSEALLFEKCNLLDHASWNEVVEERFLGRICGLPTCSNTIVVDFRRKFVVDKVNGRVFATNSEFNKYCTPRCHGISRSIQAQLDPVPLWLQTHRPPRQFSLPEAVPIPTMESIAEDPISSAPSIVKRMNEFRLAEHLPVSTGTCVEENVKTADETANEEHEDEVDTFIDWLKKPNDNKTGN